MVWVVSFQKEVVAVFITWETLVKEIECYDFDKIEAIRFYE